MVGAVHFLHINPFIVLRVTLLICLTGYGGSIFVPIYADDGVVRGAVASGLGQEVHNNASPSAIRKMLNGEQDPYFKQLSPDEFDAFKSRQYSDMGDLGFDFCIAESGVVVISSIFNIDLLKQGVDAGDLILAVNDKALLDLTDGDIQDVLSIPSGQAVKLDIFHVNRDAKSSLILKTKRALIKTVTGRLIEKHIGYTRISSFLPQTPIDLRKVIEDLEHQAEGKLQGWIIDLRDNPGGDLQAAVDSVDLIMDSGIITTILDGEGKIHNLYYASSGDAARGLPIVLLINPETASAAELFAAALQDNKRALILGNPSFGKDTIQTTHAANGGGAIKRSTARYLTPLGHSISPLGLQPDIVSNDNGSAFVFIFRLMDLSADKNLRCADKAQDNVLIQRDAEINKAVTHLNLTPSFLP